MNNVYLKQHIFISRAIHICYCTIFNKVFIEGQPVIGILNYLSRMELTGQKYKIAPLEALYVVVGHKSLNYESTPNGTSVRWHSASAFTASKG